MADDYTQYDSTLQAEPRPPRPAFFNRLWMIFVQPGEMFRALALNPAWFPIAVFAGVLVAGVMWMIPAQLFVDAATAATPPEQAAETAAQIEQIPPIFFKAMASGALAGLALFLPLILSVLTYVTFVFIRGDNSTYKQHLCVMAHTGIITAVGTVVHTFLRVRSGDMTTTLTVGSFFPFLSDGYLLEFLRALGLFQLWAAVVAGIGLAEADPARKAGSTAAVLIGMAVVFALVTAAF